MDRIIKYYNEGTPRTITGLPAGGNAASAVTAFLTGAPTGTLSYDPTAVQQGDAYLAAAKAKREAREALALTTASTATTSATNTGNVSGEDKMEERKAKGGDLYQYNYLTDPATVAANAEMDRLGIDPDRNETMFSGGGADGQGNFGTFGDYVGGITDSLGITDYAGDSKKDAAAEKAYNQKVMSNFNEYYGSGNTGVDKTTTPEVKKEEVYDYSYNYDGYNRGGPIGYNAGAPVNPSGISIAESRKDDEEERQRSVMNAMVKQQQQGPLGQIGTQMAGKALGNGLQSAALKAGVSTIPGIGPLLSMFL